MYEAKTVKVWDPLVRIGHWVLAAAFLVAFATEDDLLALHSFAGYVALAVVAVRIPWGIIGTRYARFTSFVRRPAAVAAYLRDVLAMRPARYLGHNPAGGLMIVAMLATLVLTGASGIAALALEEQAGPLAAHVVGGAPLWLRALGATHEGLANFLPLLVVAHLCGVALTSLQHRENLVRSMFTGVKAVGDERP